MRRWATSLPLVLIFIAMVSRLIPHVPNFTPIAAMALLGGATLTDRKKAYALPLLALLLSDAMIGFYSGIVYVYVGFLLTVFIGTQMASKLTALRIGASATLSSIAFFIISNFGVWMSGGLYPKTMEGLRDCYVAAIPFFHQSLAGDLFYSAAFFSLYQGARALMKERSQAV